MNQFTVPQFIDVEDKIFGPVTTRQFIILLVSGLVLFVVYKLADIALFIFFMAIIGGFALILAFVKINGQAFHYFVLNIFQTLRRPSRRLWSKGYTTAEIKEIMRERVTPEAFVPPEIKHMSYNRLRDLTLLVNTGGYYKPE